MKHLLTLPYEIWRDIKGYEGLYQVSNFGRVKSLKRCITYKDGRTKIIKEKILKPMLCNTGYYKVGLSKNGVVKEYLIHRLIAEAFIDNPDKLPMIDHINTIRTDNRVENLRWANGEIQMSNPFTKEHLVGKHTNRKDQSKPVLQYTLDMVLVSEYPSIEEAFRLTEIRHISECCLGKRKSAGGYIWVYKEKGT